MRQPPHALPWKSCFLTTKVSPLAFARTRLASEVPSTGAYNASASTTGSRSAGDEPVDAATVGPYPRAGQTKKSTPNSSTALLPATASAVRRGNRQPVSRAASTPLPRPTAALPRAMSSKPNGMNTKPV